MLMLKEGVNLQGLRPEILAAILIANDAYKDLGRDCIITSALDGTHSHTSLHYAGCAVDLRIRHLDEGEAMQIMGKLADALTDDYDIILEDTHIHVEYQPRKPS